MPTLSVLIPCYKQARFLGDAVASLRAQTFEDWEAIIVASDEDSEVRAYELVIDPRTGVFDPRIHVIPHPASGVTDARNVAARAAKASLLLPLDADDAILPTFMARTLAVIGTARYAVAHSDTLIYGSFDGEWCPTWSRTGVREANCLPYCALHTKALWESVGGWDVAMVGYEDYAYWVTCSRFDVQVTRIPEKLFRLRRWDDSRSVHLDPWDKVWRAMIRLRHPDLYTAGTTGQANLVRPSMRRKEVARTFAQGGSNDRRTIAQAKGLLGRLKAQLAHFPDNEPLREWVALIEGSP